MGQPPDDDDERDTVAPDPDRAAILARRQRFIALALTGLATTACDKPNEDPQTPKDGKAVQQGHGDDAEPHPCLKVAAPPEPDGGSTGDSGKPMPCLEVAPPPDDPPPPPHGDDAPPQPCLNVVPPPEPEDEPKPQPCLRVRPPQPKDDPPAKPRPCLKVAKPRGA